MRSEKVFHISSLVLCWFFTSAQSTTAVIQTTAGPLDAQTVGLILPHEHIFTDLRGPQAPGYGQADPEKVLQVMKPLLMAAKAKGVDLLVECSSVGVGRNVRVLARLAKETGLSIVIPTGVYARANFAPQRYRDMSEQQLTEWMVKEIRQGIEGTGVRAGFIKLASSRTQLTELEERLLRAAAQAALDTGVVIASHTTSGPVALKEVDILEEEGLPPGRFIWVHSQAEKRRSFHKQLAAQGVYIELDSIGRENPGDEGLIEVIHELIDAGYVHQLLLSHDAGWYDPAKPDGGQQRPYTYLVDTFIPKLRDSGLDEGTIRILTVENPRRAFSHMHSK